MDRKSDSRKERPPRRRAKVDIRPPRRIVRRFSSRRRRK